MNSLTASDFTSERAKKMVLTPCSHQPGETSNWKSNYLIKMKSLMKQQLVQKLHKFEWKVTER